MLLDTGQQLAKINLGRCLVIQWGGQIHASWAWALDRQLTGARGLRIPQTKMLTSHGWHCVNYVLGGSGRNRTTDTRIFNPWFDDTICIHVNW
jgi:hypothetical protein